MRDTVLQFENIIINLKRPILEATEKVKNNDAGQNLQAVLDPLKARMSEIHSILIGILEGKPPESTSGIKKILEKYGILSDLQENPELKESLIRSANIMLKEYPYTPGGKHIHKLQSTHTPSDPNIVPNNEPTV